MNIQGLHIELTNRCYLKCPLCARTEFLKKFKQKNWDNVDLSLENLQNFIDLDLSKLKIMLSGNYGDPIYHPDFLEFIKWFKLEGATINICTNGSYKQASWWENLINLLSIDDTIHFAIDGTEETFKKYRINGDWKSIETGLNIVGSSKVNSTWRFIPFAFNEHQIPEVDLLRKKYKIKNFEIIKSSRYDLDSSFMPKDSNLSLQQTHKKIEFRKGLRNIEIDPECLNYRHHYISASGFYTPCCYFATHGFYYKSKYYKNREYYNIKNNKLSKVLFDERNFFDSLQVEKYEVCQYNCAKI